MSIEEYAEISIHAPRTGSDARRWTTLSTLPHFNPRSPHGERPDALWNTAHAGIFQSTLPARGATACPPSAAAPTAYFNPRSPHGERRARACGCSRAEYFNPRSPHGERHSVPYRPRRADHFNPRSPHGERLDASRSFVIGRNISIHAPRTGSDCVRDGIADAGKHFNPRSPHGERLFFVTFHQRKRDFNPRSPHGERLVRWHFYHRQQEFQSTLPARGATRFSENR